MREKRESVWSHVVEWVFLATVGVCVGVLATLIELGTDLFYDFRSGLCTAQLGLDETSCILNYGEQGFSTWHDLLLPYLPYVSGKGSLIFISATLAGLSALLIRSYHPESAGSGVPEVMLALQGKLNDESKSKLFGPLAFVIKSVGLVLAAGSGLKIGYEGPFIHLAFCVSFNLGRTVFINPIDVSQFGSACAAAFAVAFVSPFGGCLFIAEELLLFQKTTPNTLMKMAWSALLAVSTIRALHPYLNSGTLLFEIEDIMSWHWAEIPAICMLGAISSFGGIVFSRCYVALKQLRTRHVLWNASGVSETVIVSTITTLLCSSSVLLSVSYAELIENLVVSCSTRNTEHVLCADLYSSNMTDTFKTILHLLYAAIVSLVLSIISTPLRVPSGTFIPSFANGALIGRLWVSCLIAFLSFLQQSNLPILRSIDTLQCISQATCLQPQLYALVGACAFLSGVTNSWFSIAVLSVELTGRLRHTVPLVFAVLSAKAIGNWTQSQGLYTTLLALHPLSQPLAPREIILSHPLEIRSDDFGFRDERTHLLKHDAGFV